MSDSNSLDVTSSSTSSSMNDTMASSTSSNHSKNKCDVSRLTRTTTASRAKQEKNAKIPATPRAPTSRTVTKTVRVPTVLKTAPVTTGKAGPRRKACSTPTKDDMTLSDLTLDASCIGPRVQGHTDAALDVSVAAPPAPMTRLGMVGRASGRARPNTTKPKLPAPPPRPTVVKVQSRSREVASEDIEDEISEEVMEAAYTKYLQSLYIATKSQENKDKIQKKCDKQLFQAFTATEELRQQVLQKQKENVLWASLNRLGRSLKAVRTLVSPALEVLETTQQELGRLAEGLSRVQHNLIVQGVTIADEQEAEAELDAVCAQLEQFHTSASFYDTLVVSRAANIKKMASQFEALAESYSRSLQLIKECRKLVSDGERLAIHEASVTLSLEQLKKEQEKS